jgi:DNA-binding transcriptional ArsR family regulator
MQKGEQRHVIRSKEQLSVLVAAARQEILDVLAGMGTVSVAEIATTLGRPPDALYFHIRALKKTGLVIQTGRRSRRGRKEAMFRTVAPDLWLHYDPKNEANRRAVTSIVGSMLRLGARDFRRAFERGDAVVSGPQRELWALRKTGRLSQTQITMLNRSIERLKRDVSNRHAGGRLYGVTVLLTPLDHRRRETKRSKPQTGARKK